MTEPIAGNNGANDNPKITNELPKPAQEPKDDAEASHESSQPRRRSLLVRYGRLGFIGQFRHNEREIPNHVRHVVIKTERGLELGEIISPFFHHRARFDRPDDEVAAYCAKSGPDYPLSQNGKLVRFATEQDRNEQKHLDINSEKEIEFCQSLIRELELPMKLVTAEHLFGGDRIIFYFMADGRVDFRELVRRLAQEYQTRIEMRQVGARDEARLVADIETCGRECCCKNFLKILCPVNMRMAKQQKATLDPSKISGSCGRLKCCLRYEDDVYGELSKNLPRRGSCVLTKEGPGTVIDIEVLSQQVKVAFDDNRVVVIPVGQIVQSNYRRPEPQEGQPATPAGASQKNNRPPAAEPVSVGGVTPPGGDGGREQGDLTKKRRRRRRKKKGANAQNLSAAPVDGPPPAPPEAPSDANRTEQ